MLRSPTIEPYHIDLASGYAELVEAMRASGGPMPRPISVGPLLALLSGCPQEAGISGKGGAEGATYEADIDVSPRALDFEALVDGATAAQTVTVSNLGDATLYVDELRVEGSGAFTLPADLGTLELAPGASTSFDVTFQPMSAADEGELILESSDPDEPELPVTLTGAGLFAELSLWPSPYDLGDVLDRCTRAGEITVENVGDDVATVSAVTLEAGAIAVTGLGEDGASTLPYTLAPGETLPVQLLLSPREPGELSATLWVDSDEPAGRRSAELSGEVLEPTTQTDNFRQGRGDQTDIIIYVDRSCSMEDDLSNLASNFSTFIAALDAFESDWQLLVATADDGCHNETFFTPETENAEETFLSAIFGPAGNWTEAGLTVATEALAGTGAGGCNEGFLREDANLGFLLVSDEVEQSVNSYDYYLDILWSYNAWGSVSAVAGDVPGGCASAEPGSGYYEAVIASEGVFLSICDADWGEYSTDLVTGSGWVYHDEFALSATPFEDSIGVTVDGVESSEWTYDAEDNAVRFDEDAQPEPGQVVSVSYQIYENCD